MPIEQETQLVVSCDNPACPNRSQLPSGLSSDATAGWVMLTASIGLTTAMRSGIFCTADCAQLVAELLAELQTEGLEQLAALEAST
jgi:hypothetical protein